MIWFGMFGVFVFGVVVGWIIGVAMASRVKADEVVERIKRERGW